MSGNLTVLRTGVKLSVTIDSSASSQSSHFVVVKVEVSGSVDRLVVVEAVISVVVLSVEEGAVSSVV